MSFNVNWSQRNTEYWRDNTPKVVAPGTYDPRHKTGDDGKMIGKETSAPFNTVKEREVHDHVDNIPGPGHYTKQYEYNSNRLSSANPNNSFKSKVSRFAPMAPGSTVFKTASSFFNPGPGSYFK
jgi:hypothetical protein